MSNRLTIPTAPSTAGFGHSADGYSGALVNEGPNDVVVMTGLQIAMAREIGGWPLYTIIIAAGQVGVSHLIVL